MFCQVAHVVKRVISTCAVSENGLLKKVDPSNELAAGVDGIDFQTIDSSLLPFNKINFHL